MWYKSCSMRFSSEVLLRHPLICAHPVIPAFILCRSIYCGNVSKPRNELRPLRPWTDDTHFSAEHISRTVVTHPDWFDVKMPRSGSVDRRSVGSRPAPFRPASTLAERKLQHLKRLPVQSHAELPIKIGPGDVSLTDAATTHNTGANSTRATEAPTTSSIRFEDEVPPVQRRPLQRDQRKPFEHFGFRPQADKLAHNGSA